MCHTTRARLLLRYRIALPSSSASSLLALNGHYGQVRCISTHKEWNNKIRKQNEGEKNIAKETAHPFLEVNRDRVLPSRSTCEARLFNWAKLPQLKAPRFFKTLEIMKSSAMAHRVEWMKKSDIGDSFGIEKRSPIKVAKLI